MKITRLETFLTNAGLRNYLFVRLTTDTGLTGLGEASLEWQEKTVQTLIREWVEDRILGVDPLDHEAVIGGMIRDQYQGGATIMTAISGVEIALWDILGKEAAEPVYKLLGGRCRDRLPAYANGWYGGARTGKEYAARAREVVSRGYRAMKFDPFGTAWKEMTQAEQTAAESIVAAVREAVGDEIDLMIEVHGRLSTSCAIAMGQRLAKYRPAWYEEPVTPHSLDLLKEVKDALPFPIAAGERLYMLEEFERLIGLGAADVVQMDPAHCGGLQIGKKIATLAKVQDLKVSPHCSIGPVALCAALHFDWSTPNVIIQENFAEYDVPWRNELVFGWNPIKRGEFCLAEKPGLGIELNVAVCAAHPYRKNSFPSLWDKRWLKDFTQS
ncbi:MAG TPA: mandelate racemase/muconate lactonizing enzyme family protein [Gemmataceae bacterium]|jgi:galactonate dehydratase|nr:mandelate racemase/muconate lactonizing enzyme family protein [Gemmataceae bacterium]